MIMTGAWLLLLISFTHQVTSECEVLANEPWPHPYLFVPQDATVQINCTASDHDSSVWAIDLANDSIPVQYQFEEAAQMEILNAYGVYELSTVGTPETLRLLINDTAINNQTKIICGRVYPDLILFVYQPARLVWKDVDMTTNGINISWTQESSDWLAGSPYTAQAYSLTISYGSSSQVIPLNESFYYFTVPDGAPPCEVYNFSVITTYVGATYIGDDCSAPSKVLSRMLPPLPDIDQVESSLSYSLTKHPKKGIILRVSFEQTAYCPNHNYILVLNGTSNESTWQHEISTPTLVPGETKINNIKAAKISIDYLTDNTILKFSILVTNNMTEDMYTATIGKDIYTTDLQGVKVVVTEASATVEVMCDFIPDSDAQGCMVVLLGESENTTVNLTRDDKCTIKTLPLTTFLNDAFGFDIESDGSVGTLAIPGTIISATAGDPLCLPKKINARTQISPAPGMPWIIAVTCISVIVLLLVANIAFTIVYCYIKRFKFPTENKKVADEAQEAMSYYEKPRSLFPKRKSTCSSQLMPCNGTEYCRTSHTISLQLSPCHDPDDADGAAYAKLPQDNESHVYHVLERDRPPRGIEVHTSSQTGQGTPPDLPPPHAAKITMANTSDTPPNVPPTHKDSTVLTHIPVYDDVVLKESQPSAVPSTPIHPDTPPKLPPRGSAIHCGSETSPKLPPLLYDEVLPKEITVVPMAASQRLHNQDSPSKLKSPCDGEASSSDTETPPPLPPPYRDSVVLTCTPLYDEVLPKEVTAVPMELTQMSPNSDSPSELPSSCDGEATSSDTETPPVLPPPYRDSVVLTCTPLYAEVLPKEVTAVPMGLTQMSPNPDSPSELPSSCDGEITLSDTETPPPLPPPYRDSVVLTCTPLYDEVLPKEVTVILSLSQTSPNPDSPSRLPSSCNGEASSSDTETSPPLLPPCKDSALLMHVYDDVILRGSPASQTTESNVII